MNCKAASIALVVLTAFIFGGNYFLARSQNDCSGPCQAKVTFLKSPKSRREPSCSLKIQSTYDVFVPSITRYVQLKDGDCLDLNKPNLPPETTVFCDEEMSVELEVKGSKIDFSNNPQIPASISLGGGAIFYFGGGKLTLSCEVGKHLDWFLLPFIKPSGDVKIDRHDFEWWVRGKPKTGSRLNLLQASKLNGFSHHQRAADEPLEDKIVTGVASVRLISGDVGIEKDSSAQRRMFITAGGEVEIQSFCTGDAVTLVGPSMLTLPGCERGKTTGRWQGAYARRLSKNEMTLVPFNLNLSEETSGRLGGELKTPDGTFSITRASYNSLGLHLEAHPKESGSPRKIELSGHIYEGDIALIGREYSGVAGSPDYNIEGFAERLYIANSALPPAIIGQPYSFTLTPISHNDNAIAFRVADGRLPRGISFDSQSGTLSGTPTELGSFNIRVVADDASGNVFEQPLTLMVKKLVLTNRWLPDAFVGQRYAATFKVAGGRPPYHFSGSPPPGLHLDPNTGELSGTPSFANDNTGFEVTVRDGQNNSESLSVSLRVRGTTILTSHFLPEATQGMPYHTQFQVAGNSSPAKWSIAGGNVSFTGLVLDPQTGELSGTPTRAGAFLLSVLAQASDGQSRTFALTVKQGRIVLGSEGVGAPKSEPDSRRAIGQAWNYNPSEYRGKNGQRFTYVCPAKGEPYELYGTDTYADHSSLCTSAVHAGLITFERGGTVTIEIRPGQSSYQGSRRNGVNSRSWHSEDGSFVFVH